MGVTMYKKKRHRPKPVTTFARTGIRDRIKGILSDGKHHDRKELKEVLWDELSDFSCVRVHVHFIRKSLPQGWRIIYEFIDGVHGYRMVPPK